MKKLLLFLTTLFLFNACSPPTPDPVDMTEGATVQRLLSGTTIAEDSIKIRLGEITLMPELFSYGRVIGFGTIAHTLSQAGYTNSTAATAWPRTNARYGTPINVTTMTLDWICHQEMSYVMEDYASTYCESPGGKYYKFSNSWKLPKLWASNGRGNIRKFIVEGHGSAYKSISTTDIVLIDVYPVDQTNANALLDNQYVFRDMLVIGNKSKLAGNVGIRVGASVHPVFNNIFVSDCGIGIDLQFCLETSLTDINIINYGVYGMSIANGKWTGAAGFNAQSNIVRIENYRSYNGKGYTPVSSIYLNGNHTICGNVMTFEGDKGGQHHIFYENTSGSGVNVFELSNIYIEYSGCTKSAIKIRSGKGQYVLNQIRNSVPAVDMPVLVEVDNNFTPSNSLHVFINNSAMSTINSKFRAVGNTGYPSKWYVTNVAMNDNMTFNSPANFDTSIPYSYIPKASNCRFVKPL